MHSATAAFVRARGDDVRGEVAGAIASAVRGDIIVREDKRAGGGGVMLGRLRRLVVEEGVGVPERGTMS
jgi:hypothetical protein